MNRYIIIREATESDLPSVSALIFELFKAMDHPPHGKFQHIENNCSSLINDPSHHILVAVYDHRVVGLIHFFIRRTLINGGPSGLIDELVISKDFRGQGIGTSLVTAAIEVCQSHSCEELEVGTEKTNSRAKVFYQKCGFDEEAVLLEMDLRKVNHQ